MERIRLLGLGVAGAMVIAIVLGFAAAPEGAASELLTNTWGIVTIVDLYLALAVGWAWLAWREQRAAVAAVWAVAFVGLGSVALGAYVAVVAARSSSIEEVLLGPGRVTDPG